MALLTVVVTSTALPSPSHSCAILVQWNWRRSCFKTCSSAILRSGSYTHLSEEVSGFTPYTRRDRNYRPLKPPLPHDGSNVTQVRY